MKRILLLFVFLISNVIFSQKAGHYILNYNVSIRHSRPGNVCYTNYTYITAYTKNNKKIQLSKYHARGFGPVYINDATKIISIEDKITSIRFESKLNDQKGSWPCLGSDESDWRSPVALSDYPCVTKSVNNFINEDNYTVYDSFNAMIFPKAYISFTENQIDTIRKIVCKTDTIKLYASKGFNDSFKNKIYKWEFLDLVNVGIEYTDEYQILRDEASNLLNEYLDCTLSSNDKNDQNNLGKTSRKNLPPKDDCKRWYTLFEIAQEKVNNYTGITTKDVYYWRPITIKNGESSPNILLSDLYSNTEDQKKALNNKVINIRLNPSCAGDKDVSNIVQVQFLPEPPKMAQPPTFNSPKCSYNEVENFTLYFERQLYANEKININLFKRQEGEGGVFETHDNNTDITSFIKVNESLYKYTWVNKLKKIEGGEYQIKVSGYKKTKIPGETIQNCDFPTYPEDLNNGKTFYTIKAPEALTYTAKVEKEETCFGSKDGEIKITAKGGKGVYRYSLNGGSNWSSSTFTGNVIIANKAPGTYYIVVKDTSGCIDKTKNSITVVIKSASEITHKAIVEQHPSAPGSDDGSIKIISITEGTLIKRATYKYEVYDSSKKLIKKGDVKSGGIILGLPAGAHKIVYTNKKGCSTQQYTLPTLIDRKAISFDLSSTAPDCFGGNGKITISKIKGGSPKYTVIVKENSIVEKEVSNIAKDAPATVINIPAGNYEVTIQDNRDVTKTEERIVSPRSKITVEVKAKPILCNKGNSKITIKATGGKTGLYEYAEYKTSGMMRWQDSNIFFRKASPRIGYRFIVREKGNATCQSDISDRKNISEPRLLEVVNSATVVEHNNIFGKSEGKITLTIDGGTPDYTVNWKKIGEVSFPKKGNSIEGLSAGYYIATITDEKGCSVTSDKIEIKQNPELSAKIVIIKEINCHGDLGSMRVDPIGGSKNYTYKWFKGGTEISGKTTNHLNNVIFGNYSVQVRDEYTNTKDTIKLIGKSKLKLQVSKKDITCFGKEDGTIKITASGGSGGYLYSIDDETSYQKVSTLTKSNYTITDLFKGTYKIWIKDKNDCKIATSIEVKIEEPTKIKIDAFSITDSDTTGGNQGKISIEVSGGKGNLSYKWTKDGSSTFSKTTKNITGLYAGMYSVIIKDDNYCELIKSFEVKEPLPIQVSIKKVTDISCFNGNNGSLLAVVIGGYPIESTSSDFDYKWYLIKNGIEISLNTDVSLNNISNLKTGKYKVVVNDSKGKTTNTVFTLNQPSQIKISLSSKQDIKCFEGADGKIDITVIGGTSPYKYSWSKVNDGSFSSANQDISDVKSGNYKVEVKDNNDCVVTSITFNIAQPASPLKIESYTIANLKGYKTNDGSISITPKGGTPNYTYEWRKKGETNIIGSANKIENLQARDYEVTVIDVNYCKFIEKYTVIQPDLLEVIDIKQSVAILCFGDQNIELTSSVKGGVEPYTYEWYRKGSSIKLSETSILQNIGAGNYIIKIIDANLIKTSKEYNLTEPLLLEISSIKAEDVSCRGENTGSIEVAVKGGVKPYVYSWNHGVTGSALTNLLSGTYTLTIRDRNFCEIVKEIVISEPLSSLSVKNEVTIDATGNDLSNGSITVEIEGGTPSYTYQWRDSNDVILSNTTNILSEIKAGDYILTVVDYNKCKLTLNYTINEPLPLLVEVEETAVLCNGGEGKLTTKVTGGVEKYTYTWYNLSGVIIGTDSNLNYVSGIYNLEVLDSKNNLTRVDNITLSEPLLLEISFIKVEDVSCHGENTGSIEVAVKGGVAPYIYNWSHGVTGNVLTNLLSGTYTLTIRDRNFCEIVKEIVISEPLSSLSVKNEVTIDATGNDLSNGSITVEIEGGTPSYTYQWRDSNDVILSNTTNILSEIKAGDYILTVVDYNKCKLTLNYTINEPLPLLVEVEETAVLCNGGEGKLTTKVTGGVEKYTYTWYNLSGVIIGTDSNLNYVSGIYNLEVLDSKNNLTKVDNITLSEPLLLAISSVNTQDVLCYQGNDGSIIVNVMGGVAPYSYSWSHDAMDTNEVVDLTAGLYTVKVTDKNGCAVLKENIEILEPEIYKIKETRLIRPSNTNTNNGTIEITIIGGVAPYVYIWENENSLEISNITSNNPSDRIENLTEGRYTITITDSKGCVIKETYNLADPGELLVSITQIQEISCFGGNNGILDVITVGGAGGNNYKWYSVATRSIIGNNKKLENIPAGQYYIVVNNAEGIQEQSSILTVEEPSQIRISESIRNLSCFESNNGILNLNISGGTDIYEYRYRLQGNSFSDWIKVKNNTTEIKNLQAGTYGVQLRDSNNCYSINTNGEDEYIYVIEQPNLLTILTEEIKEPTGFGLSNGSISLIIEGGTAPYNYVWKKGINTISETTINSFNNNIKLLSSGDYSIVITDSKGCVLEKSYKLEEPLKLEVTVILTSIISCQGENNGALQANVTGGILGYTYKWFKEGDAAVLGTDKNFSGIGESGIYYVGIEDSKGNTTRSASYELIEPKTLTVALSSDYVLCGTGNDWTINSIVVGGTAPYSYLWNTGSSTANLNGVELGSYELTVVDINGCRSSVNVELVPSKMLTILTEEVEEPTGFGLSNGSISLTISGGTAPYNYVWKKGANTISETTINSFNNNIKLLSSGDYSIVITDSKGCVLEKSYKLEEPLKLEVTVILTSIISCQGENNGALQANVTGGILGYTYKWFKEGDAAVLGTDKNFSGIGESGIYYVGIEDSKGNTTRSASYELIEPKTLTVALSSDYVLCGTGNDWTINSIVVGGTAPYSYLWNTGSSTANLNGVELGSYELTVVDINGCRSTVDITPNAPIPLSVNDFEIMNPTCYEGNDGGIILNIVGGVSPYKVTWNNQLTGSTIENLIAGVYEALITDNRGCTYMKKIKIVNPKKIEFNLGEDVTLCKGQSYILNATLDTGIKYQWTSSNGYRSSEAEIEVSKSGVYTVVITTQLGCAVSDSIEIKQSTAEINSEFIMSTQIYTNESFVIVNISDPKPDEVVWFFPINTKVIEKNDNYAEILIEEEGEYEITVISKVGDCEEFITKKVLVLEKEIKDNNDDNVNKSILNSVVLYPNPSSGKFKLDIKLNKKSPINLKFYRLNSTMIKEEEYFRKNIYELDYNFNLIPGIYLLLIETKKERIIKKILIR
ncbi:T9SS type A sorting domain-containing protein [Tenacibaculum finnmarkense]|uniref:T9SS type A sorting domain-containing protein n=1 Tax=Tenacibaculum finnmarkense TaxID=2781243 RepID=UPI001EFAADCC|nr:T9SS type A sorting domain-containing protein [Tenacibaculum finnmarkense]MCG8207862.1 SprB repeat-containing protein [Tenacibaculum finnmarkense genomovar finnmarkense]MCG8723924.1 hypothetical protein [Tenacibaculum finnmarkense]MCG8765627.1 hypothetical protein [Tenacibaculum finnmarkense]MCG8778557.1 hypothetical protein [Tenacibaculum finnmarkense]MCM8907048.1 SprB repeat-containing protein [Tenacibaculum finnmarkense genomovar finnmarkense]